MQINNMTLCDFCFEPITPGQPCPRCGLTHDTYPATDLLPVGTNLMGKYIIGRTLGRGGFGATYLAYSASKNGRVAVKEFYPSGIAYRDRDGISVALISEDKREIFQNSSRRFFHEAETLSRFNTNTNIVDVYEFFQCNNTVYYVMEYLDGVDLKNYTIQHGGRVSEAEAVTVMRQVCRALKDVHSTGALHLDVAPDNIFLCNDGSIKLVDFGAAKQVIGEESQNIAVVLKQGFAPLEQYSSTGNQGMWTDLYALGATIFYILAGRVPDSAPDRLSGDPDQMFQHLQNVTPQLAGIVRKCLQRDIKSRYQNTVELERDLNALPIQDVLLQPGGPGYTAPEPRSWQPSQTPPRDWHTSQAQPQVWQSSQTPPVQPQPQPVQQQPQPAQPQPQPVQQPQPAQPQPQPVRSQPQPVRPVQKAGQQTAPANQGGGHTPVKKGISPRVLLPALAGVLVLCIVIGVAVSHSSNSRGGFSTGGGSTADNSSTTEVETRSIPQEEDSQEEALSETEAFLLGEWIAVTLESDSHQFAADEILESDFTLDFRRSGTCWIVMDGDTYFSSWSEEDGVVSISDSSGTLTAYIEGEQLRLHQDEMDVYFEKTSAGDQASSGSSISSRPRSGDELVALAGVYPSFALAVREDGTVMTTGIGDNSEYSVYDWDDISHDVSGWTDIVAVSAGFNHAVGLKKDGTVVATGESDSHQRDVGNWSDIVSIYAGIVTTIGVKSDGTAVMSAPSYCEDMITDVEGWTDIVSACACHDFAIGLKSDGTVVATGDNQSGQCDVEDWTDIVAIDIGDYHTVGLRSDGTVVATGDNFAHQCDVGDWTDIVAISVDDNITVGLKQDGTVVVTDPYGSIPTEVKGWRDIIAISSGGYGDIVVGLKADGSLVAAGDLDEVPGIEDWTGIKTPD